MRYNYPECLTAKSLMCCSENRHMGERKNVLYGAEIMCFARDGHGPGLLTGALLAAFM